MRGFPAQADRNGFIKAANGIDDMGIKFDTFIFGVAQFPIGSEVGEVLLLECFFGFDGIRLGSEAGMAGDEAEHSDSDILRLGRCEHFLNHFGIRVLPAGMQDAGVDSEADTKPVILAASGGVDAFVEVGGIKFILIDCLTAIDAPGDDGLVIGFDGKQIADICAFGKQHKEGVGESRKEINEYRREVCNVVEGEGVEHFAHIEADFVQRASGEFGDLLKHCVVVDVDFDEGVVFAINERKIAIRATIRTAIGDGNEFVIWSAAKAGTELPVEFVNERGGMTNHQGSFAFDKGLANRMSGGRGISLMADSFDLCGGEKLDDSLRLACLGDFFPK
jgi:hypothetical protein